MANLILNNIYLILFIPLWIFLITMIGRFFAVYVNPKIVYALTLASSFLGLSSCGYILYKFTPDTVFEYQIPFIKVNSFIISCGLHIDRLALIFAFVLFIVSFFVQIFSIYYMRDEKKQYRFYGLINLFNFALGFLFFSPNLFQTYIFWEIAGLVSYLLIGFDYFDGNKSDASRKVFIMNRFGDAAFLCGIIMCAYLMYEYAPAKSLTTLAFFDMNIISTLVSAYTSTPLFLFIGTMFVTAAIVKSAQVPFYTWLQDAMEAKLPVSALLHSATLVSLGIYLLLRMSPFFILNDLIFKLIFIIGALTALTCSLSACSQSNPKKILAYSTSAQLGLVFAAIGILNIKAAVALFIAHAFIKSMLFITLPDENKKWSYFGFITFLIGGFSLSGLLFSGLISKEILVLGLSNAKIIFVSLISLLTAFYIARAAFQTAKKHGLEKAGPNILLIIAVLGLITVNIVFYLYLRLKLEYKVTEPFWAALFGWIFAYILFKKDNYTKIPLIYEITREGFYLDKFYTNYISKIYEKICNLCASFDLKVLSNYFIVISLAKAGVKTVSFIENNVMNRTVLLVKSCAQKFSEFDLRAQTKNIQTYNLYAFLIITTILTCLVLAYTAVLRYIGG